MIPVVGQAPEESELAPPSYQHPAYGQLYDLLYDDLGSADTVFYQSVGITSPDGRVLELGAGTGRITLPLAVAGVHVTAVDVSNPLLMRLRDKLAGHPTASARVELVEQDMEQLELPDRFQIAFLPFRLLFHAPTQARQLATLQAIRRHLQPGGRLFLNVRNPDYAEMRRTHGVPCLKRRATVPPGELLWEITSTFDFVTQAIERTDRVTIFDTTGRQVQAWLLPHRLRFVTPAELTLLLHVAGFDDVRLFGDFNEHPLSSASTEIVAVARCGSSAGNGTGR